MSQLPFYIVNAFTDRPFGGNPAGVCPESNHLNDIQMQAIAKQLNLVETVFVKKASAPGIDYELRFFTPHKELPIAGHPTIATWVALAINKHIDTTSRNKFKQLTKRGVQEITIEKTGTDFRILMGQPAPKYLTTIEDKARIARIFSISPQDLIPDLPVECIDTGLGHLVFGVTNLKALMSINRNIDALKEFCKTSGVSEAQIFCRETYDANLNFHTRNICPREGIEDPACGTGNCALLTYLMKHRLVDHQNAEILIEQGHLQNMPSVIYVRGNQSSNGALSLTLGGTGYIMAKGEFFY